MIPQTVTPGRFMPRVAQDMGAVFTLALTAGGVFAQGAPTDAPPAEGKPAESRPAAYKPIEYRQGLAYKSEDGSVQFKLGGYIQSDGRYYKGDDQNLAVDTFIIRRARLVLDASLFQRFDLRIQPDFGGGKTVLFDGYFNATVRPAFQIRVGKFKPPIGLERLQSARNLAFVERALPTNLVPVRDVGVQMHGDILSQTLVYAVGLFNGAPDGANGDLDTNDGKDTVVRVFYRPWNRSKVSGLKNLGIGIAASRGTQQGALPSYVTSGLVTFFKYRATAVAATTAVADGRQERVAPQLYYYVGPFGLMGEQIISRQRVSLGTSTDELETRSWEATASFVLTGEKASYDGVIPNKPLTGKGSGLGALEFVTRVGSLTVDDKAFPIYADNTVSARRAQAWGAGFNWYLNLNTKFVLDYEVTRFDEGGPSGADREDENAIFFRLQIAS